MVTNTVGQCTSMTVFSQVTPSTRSLYPGLEFQNLFAALNLYPEFLGLQYLWVSWQETGIVSPCEETYKDQQTLPSSWSLSRCQASSTCSRGLPESRLSVMIRGWALLSGSPGFKSLGDLIIYPSQSASIDGLLLLQGIRCSQSMVLTQAAWVGSGDLLDMQFFSWFVVSRTDLFKNLYWGIVDLQHCVSFKFSVKWVCYTYIHSFLDSFPIYTMTEYWVEFPVLHSRSLLVIYFKYNSLYVSIPIFLIPSPLPPPPITISLFSTSASLRNANSWAHPRPARAETPATCVLINSPSDSGAHSYLRTTDLGLACMTLCNPMDYSLPGSSIHGILQARILEWDAMPSSRGSSWLRDQTWVSWGSYIAGGVFTHDTQKWKTYYLNQQFSALATH